MGTSDLQLPDFGADNKPDQHNGSVVQSTYCTLLYTITTTISMHIGIDYKCMYIHTRNSPDV